MMDAVTMVEKSKPGAGSLARETVDEMVGTAPALVDSGG